MTGLTFTKTSINYGTRLPKIPCLKISLKPFFKWVLEIWGYLQMLFKIRLGKIVSTNKKKYMIEPLTLNICNLFL